MFIDYDHQKGWRAYEHLPKGDQRPRVLSAEIVELVGPARLILIPAENGEFSHGWLEVADVREVPHAG